MVASNQKTQADWAYEDWMTDDDGNTRLDRFMDADEFNSGCRWCDDGGRDGLDGPFWDPDTRQWPDDFGRPRADDWEEDDEGGGHSE